MKAKILFTTLALLAGVILFYLSREPLQNTVPEETLPAAVSGEAKPGPQSAPTFAPAAENRSAGPEPVLFQEGYALTSNYGLQSRLDNANALQMPALLAEIERMPDSPVKDDLLRSALTRWAALDGAAAVTWARQRATHRHLLPEILTAWATTSPEAATSAWAFAKRAFASEPDAGTWHAPGFVKNAFHGIMATPGELMWKELSTLRGETAVQAMMGMADFASNAQVNTDFTADMERRVLEMNSAPMAAAFYAAAGHIQAAKDDLAGVNDAADWHAIAQEIARQQAVFEPSKALDWLQSQFSQPSDAIEDIVASIGATHALNAGDVLGWLNMLPESDARTAGMENIIQRFPELRPGQPVQTIVLE